MASLSPPRISLSTFISSARTRLHESLKSPSKTSMKFVLGNESADLDSLASSLLLSYFLTCAPRTASPCIPVLPIPHSDLRLRPEFAVALSKDTLSSLITLDELCDGDVQKLQKNLPKEGTEWHLVDHNVMTRPLGPVYGDRVVYIIDHHVPESSSLALQPTKELLHTRIVEMCGSCTSLVVREFKDTWEALEPNDVWDAQIAKLALAAILIDTSNLSASAAKAKAVDVDMVNYLESKLVAIGANASSNSAGYDRGTFFAGLSAAKSNLSALSLDEILRKDYKRFDTPLGDLGMSSVVQPLAYLFEKAGKNSGQDKEKLNAFIDVAAAWAKRQPDLVLYAIMTVFQSGSRRELLLVSLDGGERVVRLLRESEDLRLKEILVDEVRGVGVWEQQNLRATRKQVAPLLRRLMAEVAEDM